MPTAQEQSSRTSTALTTNSTMQARYVGPTTMQQDKKSISVFLQQRSSRDRLLGLPPSTMISIISCFRSRPLQASMRHYRHSNSPSWPKAVGGQSCNGSFNNNDATRSDAKARFSQVTSLVHCFVAIQQFSFIVLFDTRNIKESSKDIKVTSSANRKVFWTIPFQTKRAR